MQDPINHRAAQANTSTGAESLLNDQSAVSPPYPVRSSPLSGLYGSWDTTAPAPEYRPLPRNNYLAYVTEGGLSKNASAKPYYEVTFTITGGEYSGRRLWRRFYLTDAAIAYSKRDLAKLGIVTALDLRQPPKEGIFCELLVVLRSDDDGVTRNDVRDFTVVRRDDPGHSYFAHVPSKTSPSGSSNCLLPSSSGGQTSNASQSPDAICNPPSFNNDSVESTPDQTIAERLAGIKASLTGNRDGAAAIPDGGVR